MTLNISKVICHISFELDLAIDHTFASQADGKVVTLKIYEVIFSYNICVCALIFSYIFSDRSHFSLTSRGKSGDAKYI